MTASELIERLVAIIPRPHKNLVLYAGVLAPNAKLRARVRSFGRGPDRPRPKRCSRMHRSAATDDATRRPLRPENSEWARLMRRASDIDVLCCPTCSARMRVIALIENPKVARRILRHLGMRVHPPPIAPARIPDSTYGAA